MRLVNLLPFVVATAVLLASASAAGGEPEHEHAPVHGQAVAGGAPVGAQERFATDETLRRNMRQIRDAVYALSGDGKARPDVARTVALSKGVAGGVLDIIEHCRLPPDADAVLHRIIHPLMVGAQALEADPADASPLASMRDALDDYAQRFDDPSFAVPAAGHGAEHGGH